MADPHKDFDGSGGDHGNLPIALSSGTYSSYNIDLILRSVLHPTDGVPFQIAANTIINILREDQRDPYSLDQNCEDLGNQCLELAEQIPYNHPSHAKLARLLEYIESASGFGRVGLIAGYRQIWDHFQLLRGDLPWKMPFEPEDIDAKAYVNCHAFVAIMTAFQLLPTNLACAFWAMRDAFTIHEEEPLQMIKIMAAAQWIKWNGQSLFKQVMCNDGDPRTRQQWLPGPFYQDRRGEETNIGRWKFWRSGFQEAAEKETYTTEARAEAKHAAELMEQIEKCMSACYQNNM
ncbi:hypothetical protein GGR55DRAFT_630272 [Xylaria sp. FL0064]|nr:hypothetical protein GGR55DRAFT_630272 [Xylaria sp. FL0064]